MTTNQEPPQPKEAIADVSARRIARVYAEALLNAAESQGQSEALLEEMESLVQDVFQADPLVESFLTSAAVGRNPKAEVLRSVFEPRASTLFFNFLMVLNAHDRLDLLRTILVAYRELRDERARRMRVQVQSAAPLSEEQRKRLIRELHETFRLEPLLETQVDPELLGGMVVRVGDWLFDASVRTQLQILRNQMIAKGSHEIQTRRDRFSTPS
jgi:F-type H+-transporting ATPase subunit delta